MLINDQLIKPNSICIVGGSNNTKKPGGKIIENLKNGTFKGKLYVVNPHEDQVQGLACFPTEHEVPTVELAIIALPAHLCIPSIKILANEKGCHAFIIISAGFSESGSIGEHLKDELLEILEQTHSCLLGPNCIGLLNAHYQGVFTSPIPKLEQHGCDLASSSGATAVFIMETSIPKGITFSSIISMGNSAQIGIEEVLEYWDLTYDPVNSSRIKLLYLETIRKPQKLLFHASSLIQKGAKIAAVKAGASRAGIRAASSHTGALATPDEPVEALFKKAGIIRCAGREELTNVAAILTCKTLSGKRIAIVTQAGGPAVMLTDVLSKNGFEVPKTDITGSDDLKKILHPGSSIQNPIDILATGTADQLSKAIDFCENKCKHIDGIVVIFGSPGLTKVDDAYNIIHNEIRECKKPVYPVLPSLLNAKEEIISFIEKGNVFFPDEVLFGEALARILNTPYISLLEPMAKTDLPMTKRIMDNTETGYVPIEDQNIVFNEVGISTLPTLVINEKNMLLSAASQYEYPLVLKAMGFVHKTDAGGISLSINSKDQLLEEYNRLISLEGTTGVILQPMIKGLELYVGAKYEPGFGHMIFCGMGGIFIEIIKDYTVRLAPVNTDEALSMIKDLKVFDILQGARGKAGINIREFANIIVKVSILCEHFSKIHELDINPLIANKEGIFAVDTRIFIKK
ncbi:MAG: acetate--CoA ligase family protein [Bacteroidales bacterium]|nr:acetate--CoA ligase family protein [Bacteroidales bacterium]